MKMFLIIGLGGLQKPLEALNPKSRLAQGTWSDPAEMFWRAFPGSIFMGAFLLGLGFRCYSLMDRILYQIICRNKP